MKVRFIKSPSGSPHSLGYFQGDEAELNEITAKELIALGIAIEVYNKPKVTEDLPIIENKSSTKPKKAIKR
jgi:hypothetical protein